MVDSDWSCYAMDTASLVSIYKAHLNVVDRSIVTTNWDKCPKHDFSVDARCLPEALYLGMMGNVAIYYCYKLLPFFASLML